MKRTTSIVKACLALLVTIATTSNALLAADKPNVVLMLAYVGWGDIGAYGGGEMRGMPTPRIDCPSEGLSHRL